MGALVAAGLWAALVLWLLVRVLRQGRAFRQQALTAQPARPTMPSVAVIVPARDEAETIGPCLGALAALDYPGAAVSVTVVDDGSTDRTAAIVAAAGVRLLTAGAVPPGWMGKPHACWLGARASGAEWLLFVDADVRVGPGLLASAVAAAEAGGIDLLSVQPLQELGSFWERLVIPAGMLMIAASARGMGGESAAEVRVNGQILLVRAETYRRAGGHRAVRDAVCEDNGLARRVLAAGGVVAVMAGEGLARVRMYRGLGPLWEGFAKNAIDIVGSAGGTAAAVLAGLAAGWAVWVVPLWVWLGGGSGAAVAVACAASGVVLGVAVGALRHFRAPVWMAVLLPVGVTVAAGLALESIRQRRAGRVRWKGRIYRQVG